MSRVHNITTYKKKRKYLRKNATRAEKLLWQRLKNSQIGFKFRRQHSIRQYVLDFYCPRLKLAVEIDGYVHDYREQREHDWMRERGLEKLGMKVVRYKNHEIIEDIDRVAANLKSICEKLKSRDFNPTTPNPSLSKEGREIRSCF